MSMEKLNAEVLKKMGIIADRPTEGVEFATLIDGRWHVSITSLDLGLRPFANAFCAVHKRFAYGEKGYSVDTFIEIYKVKCYLQKTASY